MARRQLPKRVSPRGRPSAAYPPSLNALVGLEFLTRDDAGRYTLTPESSTYLVSSKPSYFGGFLQHVSTQLIPDWLELTKVVQTGVPIKSVNQRGDGSAFFEEFVAGLFAMNYGSAVAAADALGISKATRPVRVLDLAAGSGVFGIALAQRSPQVTVNAVDWPNVLEITRKTAAQCGVADRFSYTGGDLDSADFGKGHNVATLGHILHSEGEARSRKLLKKTHNAMAAGGTIVIAEFLVDADRRGPLHRVAVRCEHAGPHGCGYDLQLRTNPRVAYGMRIYRRAPGRSPGPLAVNLCDAF